jgi:hypothetical protein
MVYELYGIAKMKELVDIFVNWMMAYREEYSQI